MTSFEGKGRGRTDGRTDDLGSANTHSLPLRARARSFIMSVNFRKKLITSRREQMEERRGCYMPRSLATQSQQWFHWLARSCFWPEIEFRALHLREPFTITSSAHGTQHIPIVGKCRQIFATLQFPKLATQAW